MSSSVVVTDTVTSVNESKSSFEISSTTETVIVVVWLPSIRLSLAPVMVTVWAESQFPEVNVRVAGETVASPVSPEDTERTTSEVG